MAKVLKIKHKRDKRERIKSAAKTFKRLGNLRNQLVRKKMSTFYIEQTSDGIQPALQLISYQKVPNDKEQANAICNEKVA